MEIFILTCKSDNNGCISTIVHVLHFFYSMATALLGKTEIRVQDTTQSTTVPDNPIAKLMYYFHCICSCVDADDTDSIRRLRDYKNYWRLTSDEKSKLLALVLALSPDKLMGQIIFPTDDCGDGSNRFLKLSAVSTKLAVSESILIGGQRRKVQTIMMFKKCWIENNYIDPLRTIVGSKPPPKNDSSCIIS